MSSGQATFVFSDGSKLYGIYHGTSDVMGALMFESEDAVSDGYSASYNSIESAQCTEHKPVPCVAHTSYGGGFWWHGVACLQCKRFLGPFMPYEDHVEMESSDEPPSPTVVFKIVASIDYRDVNWAAEQFARWNINLSIRDKEWLHQCVLVQQFMRRVRMLWESYGDGGTDPVSPGSLGHFINKYYRG